MSIESQYVQCPRSSFESRFIGEERNVYSYLDSPQLKTQRSVRYITRKLVFIQPKKTL